MAALETKLGQRLFERGRNAAEFSDAGRCALLHAHTLLADEQAMLDAFDDLARKRRTLRIASVAPSPVWRLTSLVVERCPGTLLEPSLTDDGARVTYHLSSRLDAPEPVRQVMTRVRALAEQRG